MGNYHYIISGLPDLLPDFEKSGFDLDSVIRSITEMCTDKDRRCIEWLFFGLKEENLNNHFYRSASKSGNKFIREYFKSDLTIRNIQCAYLARKNSLDAVEFIIGRGEIQDSLLTNKSADFGLSQISGTAASVLKILEIENILEREQQMDLLRWNIANEICTFNYFDIERILLFLLKASIVKRWSKLDKKTGAELFRKFVSEVKGSFKLENNN
ncbi:hypothetical protein MASR2M69_23580 [Bacteroidota bacterium]